MTALGGWAAALRMARREAMRARGRSVLVLVMIALPVLAVGAIDVAAHTADVGHTEALSRRVGTADALVSFQPHRTRVAQAADPQYAIAANGSSRAQPDSSLSAVTDALGRPVRGLERHEGNVRVVTDDGQADVRGTALDLREPLARGLFALERGRLPRATDEVAINAALADHGLHVGGRLRIVDGPTRRIVGLVRDTGSKFPESVVGLPGSLDLATGPHLVDWLVDASGGPVTWHDVRALNRIGAAVVSPWVLEHPPSQSELAPTMRGAGLDGPSSALIVVAVLVVVMALIEVVLLAGPAFAVGARAQQRNLALIASCGGTPRQLRRFVLASAVVLGAVASLLGMALSIGVATVAMPVAQRFSPDYFGPFDVRWPELAGIGAFGFVSAVVAAYVPAWLASRQDVVAVLGGRRGDPPPRARSPLLGVALFGLGVAGAAIGGGRMSGGETFIAGSAILAVLGMVLLVSPMLGLLARVSRRLPLAGRYAVRDAARHRTRTVPAVAAVAATVAGVVALGVGMTSDQAQARGDYVADLPMDSAVVRGMETPAAWSRMRTAVRAELPGQRVVEVRGIPEMVDDTEQRSVEVAVAGQSPSFSAESTFGAMVLVGSSLPAVELGVPARARDAADRMLADGGAVLLADHHVRGDRARVRVVTYDVRPGSVGNQRASHAITVPAMVVRSNIAMSRAEAVVAPAVADELGVEAATTALWVAGPVSGDVEQTLSDTATAARGNLYVERGYQPDPPVKLARWGLGLLGAVLMLGGTLTATFLALSDARSDLATLAAVGGAPRLRRRVAASYAAVTGLVGAVLGTLVGLVPGIAVSFPLTAPVTLPGGTPGPSHYLAIPWLLIGVLVVALPLVTALVVGLASRSRLPMVARVD